MGPRNGILAILLIEVATGSEITGPTVLGIQFQPANESLSLAAPECHPSARGGCTVCDKCCNDFIPDGQQCAACVAKECQAPKVMRFEK